MGKLEIPPAQKLSILSSAHRAHGTAYINVFALENQSERELLIMLLAGLQCSKRCQFNNCFVFFCHGEQNNSHDYNRKKKKIFGYHPCLYADDTQIFSSSYDYNELIDKLNSDLINISDWLARNKLQYHPTKTKFMIIGSTYNLNNKVHNKPVILNNKPLSRTSTFECLGVLLDEKLKWDKHIDKILKKVGSGIAMLRRAKKFIPTSSLQMIYALIQPYFDYCSPLWDICGKHLLDKLQKFQNRAARIIAGLSYEINSADVLESLGWETLESRRQRMKSVFLYKIINDYTAPNLKQSLIGSNSMPSSYILRSTDTDIAFPKPRTEFLKKSFKYSGAKLWNSLCREAKEAQSISTFKQNIGR